MLLGEVQHKTMQTKQPITIVHIITGLGMGGAERMLSNVVLNLEEPQFRNIVVSLKDLGYWGNILRERGITVYCLNMRPSLASVFKFFDLIKILRQHQPDCIQGWMYHANLVSTFVGKSLGFKRIYWNIRCSLMDLSHYRFTTKVVFKLGAWFSKTPTAILNNSRASIQQHASKGYNNKHLLYVPNGFDVEKFKPDPEIYNEFRKQHNLPSDAILIGIMARFDPMKDHATFIHAAAILAQQNPKVYFICAGTGLNVNNKQVYDLVLANSLQQRVLLLDQVNELQNVLPALDYLTQTSVSEGFPNVVAEAMSCGVECIVTDVGESLDIIGEYGFKIPQRDPQALAVTWNNAIARDVLEVTAARQAVRQRIIANYSLLRVTKLYGDIYLG